MPRPPAPARILLRTLEEAAVPIFALDGERKIVFANSALGDWLALPAGELIGRRCDYAAAETDAAQAACAAICPPPEAFFGQIRDGFASRLATSQLPFERRPVRYFFLPGESSAESLLLAFVQVGEEAVEDPIGATLAPERLHAALLKLRGHFAQQFNIGQLIGQSDALVRVRQQVGIAAQSRARTLIIGPRGSGREHVARTIHYGFDATSVAPLMPIACSLVDAEQMQAALATLLRKQQASPSKYPGAALLLDVDRLCPDAQQELVEFLRLPKIELRTLATSRVSLARLTAKGKFRRDLAYAISTLSINVPPLSARREDIPLLAQHFLEATNRSAGRQLSGFQAAATDLLASLPWRGNIDELAQAVEQACDRAAGPKVTTADLPDWVHLGHDAVAHSMDGDEPIELDAFLAEIEKELLARALKKSRGNKSKAAELLGLSRPRLLRRLAQLGLVTAAEIEEPVIFEPLSDEP